MKSVKLHQVAYLFHVTITEQYHDNWEKKKTPSMDANHELLSKDQKKKKKKVNGIF